MEDKKKICDLLCATLQETRKYEDLISLHYEADPIEEWVTAAFKNGGFRRACVTADSGWAMINDIMAGI